MKKLDEKSCETLFGGWRFTLSIFGWKILVHDGEKTGDKWHWWFE